MKSGIGKTCRTPSGKKKQNKKKIRKTQKGA